MHAAGALACRQVVHPAAGAGAGAQYRDLPQDLPHYHPPVFGCPQLWSCCNWSQHHSSLLRAYGPVHISAHCWGACCEGFDQDFGQLAALCVIVDKFEAVARGLDGWVPLCQYYYQGAGSVWRLLLRRKPVVSESAGVCWGLWVLQSCFLGRCMAGTECRAPGLCAVPEQTRHSWRALGRFLLPSWDAVSCMRACAHEV